MPIAGSGSDIRRQAAARERERQRRQRPPAPTSGPGPGAAYVAQAAARQRAETLELRRRQQAARVQHGFAPPTQRAGTRQGLGRRPLTAAPTHAAPTARRGTVFERQRSALGVTRDDIRQALAVDRFLSGRYNLELGPRAGGISDQRIAAARLAPKLAVNQQIDTVRNRADQAQAINALSGRTFAPPAGGVSGRPPEEVIQAVETTPGGPTINDIREYRHYYDPLAPPGAPIVEPGTGGAWDVPVGLADIVTGIPTAIRDPSWQNISLAAVGFLPLGKAGRVANTLGGRLPVGVKPKSVVGQAGRTQTYRGLTQQLTPAQSTLTANLQRGLDPLQERLAGVAENLMAGGPTSRVTGRVLTPFTARGRVVKGRGTERRVEAGRKRATLSPELTTIARGHGPGVRSAVHTPMTARRARMAHWWWAQLPDQFHNSEGLRLAQDALKRDLDNITSGRRHEELADELRAANASDDIVNTERIEDELADLELNARNLGRKIATLENAIKKGVEADPRVIDAVRTLMDDRQTVLGDRISAESLVDRPGIMLDYIGRDKFTSSLSDRIAVARQEGNQGLARQLEGQLESLDFEGLPFVGHRLGKPRGQSMAGGGVGKQRLPQGVGQRNELVLVKTGRVRDDIRVVLEDWQAAQVYEFGKNSREDLLKIGDPIRAGTAKPNHIIVNPRGDKIPAHHRVDWDAQLREQGFDPDVIDEIADNLEGIANTFATTRTEIDELIAKAREGGYYNELRQVPVDQVQRYFGQLVPPGKAGALASSMPMVGQGFDTLNNILYSSLIYSNPGFVPSSFAGNVILGGLHQGPLLLQNMARAGQFVAKAPKRLRAQVLNEVQVGAALSAASGGRGGLPGGPAGALMGGANVATRKLAQGMGHASDTIPRVASFMREAQKKGIIGKGPALTKKDYDRLDSLMNDPEMRPILNDIKAHSNEPMVNFERLRPWERAVMKRASFVWPWIRGATAYPGRFIMDYPGRSAAMGYVAYGGDLGERGQPIEDIRDKIAGAHLENAPSYLDEAFQVGEQTIGGETFPSILNLGPASPIGTAADSVRSLIGAPGSRPAYEYLNPLIRFGLAVAQGENPYGQHVGRIEALRQGGMRLAPQFGLAKDLISPPSLEDAGMYPGDVTRGGRLARGSRVAPYPVDPEAVYDAAAREGTVGGPRERVWRNVMQTRTAYWEAAKQLDNFGLEDGRLPAELRTAFNRWAEKDSRYAELEHESDDPITQQQRLDIDLGLLEKWGLADSDQLAQVREFAETATDDEIRSMRARWSQGNGVMRRAYLGALGNAQKALESRGATLPER